MSKIQVDEIVNKLDNGATSFPRGISGTTASFSGNVSVGGTLTYEDVTNIDSVGLITARSGVRVTSGGIDVTSGGINVTSGVVTATSFSGDGSALTGIDATSLKDSNGTVRVQANTSGAVVTGVITATSFEGDGSQLTGIDATALKDSNGTVRVQANGSGAVVTGVLTATSFSGELSGTSIDISGNFKQTVQAVSALNIDCSAGNYFTKTINANSTFTFGSVPSSRAYSFTLELTHTSGTVGWPGSVEWPSGSPPILNTGYTHLFIFVTDNGGSRWRGAALTQYTT